MHPHDELEQVVDLVPFAIEEVLPDLVKNLAAARGKMTMARTRIDWFLEVIRPEATAELLDSSAFSTAPN